MGQTQTSQSLINLGHLCALGFEKLPSGWRVVEEVSHLHRGALGMGDRAAFNHLATMAFNKPTAALWLDGGAEAHLGYRGHAGQGFAPKTKASDTDEILGGLNLAGGMTL